MKFRLWPRRGRRVYLQPVFEVSYDGGQTWPERRVGWDSLPVNTKHASHIIGWTTQ